MAVHDVKLLVAKNDPSRYFIFCIDFFQRKVVMSGASEHVHWILTLEEARKFWLRLTTSKDQFKEHEIEHYRK